MNPFFPHLSIFWASFTSASLGFFFVLQLVFVPVVVVGEDVVYCGPFVGLVFKFWVLLVFAHGNLVRLSI